MPLHVFCPPRETSAGQRYLSTSPPSVTFGLGTETRVERITVEYIGGETVMIDAPPIDQRLSVNL